MYIDLEGYYSWKKFKSDASAAWKRTKHQLKEAKKNPKEAIKGAIKDTLNLIPEATELILKASAEGGLSEIEMATAISGSKEDIKITEAAVEQARVHVDRNSLPKFKMSNDAQSGGAKIATGIQIATVVGGITKTGIKMTGKVMLKAGRKEMGAAAKGGEVAGEAGLTGESASGRKVKEIVEISDQSEFLKTRKATKGVHLNSNEAKGHFGIYEIEIDGLLYKVGKADLDRITLSSGLPTRLHQQIRKLEKIHGKGHVAGQVVDDLGKIKNSTAQAKAAEKARIRAIYEKTGNVPLGNERSFKP